MRLPDFFLVCFVTGFALSAASFLGSGFHLPHPHVHLHLPKGASKGSGAAINFGTLTTFLAWFGGTGYLLTRFYPGALAWVLTGAVASGLVGAAVVFFFVAHVLARNDRSLDPADYDMRGVYGKVSSTVHAGGTGEMIFSQQGVRRAAAIRSEGGEAIARGAQVLVTRFERGIAYVRPWDESQTEL